MAGSGLDAEFLRRRTSLLRRLARLVGCRATAEDLAQDTWVRAQGRGVERAAPFLDRVARNLAHDHLRRLAVQAPAGPGALDALACGAPGPEGVLLGRERVRRAEAALAGLPARRREVFLAVRLEGMAHAAVAARFGISVAAVEKHLARAMASLAAALGEDA